MKKWVLTSLLTIIAVMLIKTAFAVESVSVQYLSDGFKTMSMATVKQEERQKSSCDKEIVLSGFINKSKERQSSILKKTPRKFCFYKAMFLKSIVSKKKIDVYEINLDKIQLDNIDLSSCVAVYYKDIFGHRKISVKDVLNDYEQSIKKHNLNLRNTPSFRNIFAAA